MRIPKIAKNEKHFGELADLFFDATKDMAARLDSTEFLLDSALLLLAECLTPEGRREFVNELHAASDARLHKALDDARALPEGAAQCDLSEAARLRHEYTTRVLDHLVARLPAP